MGNPASFVTAASVDSANDFIGNQTVTGAFGVPGAQTHLRDGGITGAVSETRRVAAAPAVAAATTPAAALTATAAADTANIASVESPSVYLNLSATRQWATGALAAQRALKITAPTYGFVGASTLSDAATVAISGPPVAGSNATLTRSMALWVESGVARFDGSVQFAATATTTANPTINKPAGQVSVAIGASTVTVTNSLVTATSIVLCQLQFADATFTTILTVVPGTGSFVITGNATATALTKIGFIVINPS